MKNNDAETIHLSSARTSIVSTSDIFAGEHFANSAGVIRKITLIWDGARIVRTKEDQQLRMATEDFKVQSVEYKQWKTNPDGTAKGLPRYGQCGALAFIRWVETAPRSKKAKCPHCKGTGRL